MAYFYINDTVYAAIVKNSKKDPKEYVKETILNDIKERGWLK